MIQSIISAIKGELPDLSDLQLADYKKENNPKVLNMSNGCPIFDKRNALTVGPSGPQLMEDIVYLDEITHFDRERIPERVVHAKGADLLTGSRRTSSEAIHTQTLLLFIFLSQELSDDRYIISKLGFDGWPVLGKGHCKASPTAENLLP
ncbi:unnamed protein product [Cylicostephanus goldi]|uniref:Catalase core domain-containing protein n=1 Tax=Cylicostephanus goldi TaxID=71465 RepID=A0A3P6QMK2_CYLGO|nr:unnamed protein product [Cylicostephanus goldi]